MSGASDPTIQLMDDKSVKLSWNTAYAGNYILQKYEILRDNEPIGSLAHVPQINTTPFTFVDKSAGDQAHEYKIVTVDNAGQKAETAAVTV